MTNIEQEFFKTFGIEPKDYYGCNWDGYCPYPLEENNKCGKHCPHWVKYKTALPKITDRVLLELICILNTIKFQKEAYIYSCDYAELKWEILKTCINLRQIINQKVIQSLFREEEE